jgi:hypothetical protein
MNENLFKIYEQELAERSIMLRRNLRFHRDRGKVIHRVKSGRSLDGKTTVDYGQNPVEVLADSLGVSRSYAYKLSTFYEIYQDNEKFQDLLDSFDSKSFDLSWSHFNCLVHVKDEAVREELIEQALENKMSVRALHELLKSKRIVVDDDEVLSDDSGDAALEAAPAATGPVEMTQPEHVSDEETEEEEAEGLPEAQAVPSASDWTSSDNPKIVLRKLVTAAAKFGDKLVELVGDLTISTNEIHGSSCDKDTLKGLESSVEVLESLKLQVGEYLEQVQIIQNRLTTEKRSK